MDMMTLMKLTYIILTTRRENIEDSFDRRFVVLPNTVFGHPSFRRCHGRWNKYHRRTRVVIKDLECQLPCSMLPASTYVEGAIRIIASTSHFFADPRNGQGCLASREAGTIVLENIANLYPMQRNDSLAQAV